MKTWILIIGILTATVLVLALFALLIGYCIPVGLIIHVIAFAIASLIALFMIDRYEKSLLARIVVTDSVSWDVQVNGITVGTISDSEYAAMKLHAYRERRNVFAQIFNAWHIFMNVANKLLLAVPVMLFWCLIGLAVYYPETYIIAISDVQKAGPSAIASAIRQGIWLLGVISFLTLGVGFAFGGFSFGYVNCFSVAVGRMLRQHCNVPAEGEISLVRWIDRGNINSLVLGDSLSFDIRS